MCTYGNSHRFKLPSSCNPNGDLRCGGLGHRAVDEKSLAPRRLRYKPGENADSRLKECLGDTKLEGRARFHFHGHE